MRWAIPEYRLPSEIVRAEIKEIIDAGVNILTNSRVESIEELKKLGYHAIYIACGAQKSASLGIPGDRLSGVIGAIEFLESVKAGKEIQVGERVCVIGGGNAAIDAARTAVRMGSMEVKIFYRRTRNEMPAYPDEIDAAIEEGVKIVFLSDPSAIEQQGDALKVTFNCMELGPPDESGRPKPVCKYGFNYSELFDTVISAIGQEVVLKGDFGISRNDNGRINVDPVNLTTDMEGVFAGGDVVLGPASIIEAIGHGKRAASFIDSYLAALSLAAYNSFKHLVTEGIILYDPAFVVEIDDALTCRQEPVPAKDLSVQNFGRHVFANTIMLGAISKHLEVLNRDTVLESILHVIPRFHEENKRAFEIGYFLFNGKG